VNSAKRSVWIDAFPSLNAQVSGTLSSKNDKHRIADSRDRTYEVSFPFITHGIAGALTESKFRGKPTRRREIEDFSLDSSPPVGFPSSERRVML
jgi:hypothetical protein